MAVRATREYVTDGPVSLVWQANSIEPAGASANVHVIVNVASEEAYASRIIAENDTVEPDLNVQAAWTLTTSVSRTFTDANTT